MDIGDYEDDDENDDDDDEDEQVDEDEDEDGDENENEDDNEDQDNLEDEYEDEDECEVNVDAATCKWVDKERRCRLNRQILVQLAGSWRLGLHNCILLGVSRENACLLLLCVCHRKYWSNYHQLNNRWYN